MVKVGERPTKQNGQMPLGLGLYLHKRAARLTRTTSRKLSYWAKTELLTPHIHRRDGGPSVYSYDDLLAVRAVVRLRVLRLPLQQIRKALQYLYGHLSSESDWWNMKMVVDKRDLVVVIPKDASQTGIEEIVVATRGGQKPFELLFADLVNDLLSGDGLDAYPEIKDYITIDGHYQGGAPIVKDTRVKTSTMYFWHKCGLSSEEISELYGGLDKDAITAAIHYEGILSG